MDKVTSAKTIARYETCLRLVDALSIFSPNETLEDLNTTDLQYFVIPYHLATLYLKSNDGARKDHVLHAKSAFERFLKSLDQYDLLGKENSKLYEQYKESPQSFSVAGRADAVERREIKILRFKEEKQLKQKLDVRNRAILKSSLTNKAQHLKRNPSSVEPDDEVARDAYLANIAYYTHMTFQELEMMSLELQMLNMAASAPADMPRGGLDDPRLRAARGDGYSERLDSPISQLSQLQGPILDKNGRPLRPFTLLDNRQRFRDGVFRPDHNLPTMSIDEYLEEERKRGGIIEGGGEKSGLRPEPNEDDIEKADEETMKARAWDEFQEANPKGSGNTMNMG